MIIDNLQQALDYAGIEKLPYESKFNKPFKRAIGKIQTSCADESYAILKWHDNEPTVLKSFIGGLFIRIIAIYPYEFDNENIGFKSALQVDIKDIYKAQSTKEVVEVPIIDEQVLDKIKKPKNEWLIQGVTNIDEARKFMLANNRFYPTALQKAKLKNESRFKEEWVKFAKHYLALTK